MKDKCINSQALYGFFKPGLYLVCQAFIVGIVISLLLFLLIILVNFAQASESISIKNPEEVGQGSLLFKNNKQEYIAMDTLNTQVNMSISGLTNHTTVTQTFRNTSEQNIEAVYIFPLPENSSVEKFTLIVGDEIIEGKIMEKKAASKVYTEAKKQGKQTAIIKQQRPNMIRLCIYV